MFDVWFIAKVIKQVMKIGAIINTGLSRDISMIRKLLGKNAAKMAKMLTKVEILKKDSRFLFLNDLTAKQILRMLPRSMAGKKQGISFVKDLSSRARAFGCMYIDNIRMLRVVLLNTAVIPFLLQLQLNVSVSVDNFEHMTP